MVSFRLKPVHSHVIHEVIDEMIRENAALKPVEIVRRVRLRNPDLLEESDRLLVAAVADVLANRLAVRGLH